MTNLEIYELITYRKFSDAGVFYDTLQKIKCLAEEKKIDIPLEHIKFRDDDQDYIQCDPNRTIVYVLNYPNADWSDKNLVLKVLTKYNEATMLAYRYSLGTGVAISPIFQVMALRDTIAGGKVIVGCIYPEFIERCVAIKLYDWSYTDIQHLLVNIKNKYAKPLFLRLGRYGKGEHNVDISNEELKKILNLSQKANVTYSILNQIKKSFGKTFLKFEVEKIDEQYKFSFERH